MSRKKASVSKRRQNAVVVSKRPVLAKRRPTGEEMLYDASPDAQDFNDDLVYDEIIVLPVCILFF